MKTCVMNLCVANIATGKTGRLLASFLSVGGLLASGALPTLAQEDLPSEVQLADQVEMQTLVSQQVAAGPRAMANNRLVLSLRSRRVYLYQGEMLLSSYPVAIGTGETPTPQGEFTVSQMVENPVWQSPWTGEVHEPGPNSALGLRWIEFASTEDGSFGFHGTPTVDSIGYAASNGCVRMYNEDVVALFSQVSVGTPVSVWP